MCTFCHKHSQLKFASKSSSASGTNVYASSQRSTESCANYEKETHSFDLDKTSRRTTATTTATATPAAAISSISVISSIITNSNTPVITVITAIGIDTTIPTIASVSAIKLWVLHL